MFAIRCKGLRPRRVFLKNVFASRIAPAVLLNFDVGLEFGGSAARGNCSPNPSDQPHSSIIDWNHIPSPVPSIMLFYMSRRNLRSGPSPEPPQKPEIQIIRDSRRPGSCERIYSYTLLEHKNYMFPTRHSSARHNQTKTQTPCDGCSGRLHYATYQVHLSRSHSQMTKKSSPASNILTPIPKQNL